VSRRIDLADLLTHALRPDGEIDAAARQYRAVLASQPHRGDVWLKLGRLYEGHQRVPAMSADHRAEALRAYRQAIACAPSVFVPYVDLYRLVLRTGTVEDALAETEHLNGCGDPEQMVRGLAGALKTLGRHEEAIACCSGILSRHPGDEVARITRAESFTALREIEAATADIEEAVRTHPTSEYVGWTSLLHLVRLGRWDEAQRRFRAAHQFFERPSDRGLPAWTGRPAPGKTILFDFRPTLAGDALGYGDLFQMSRFLKLARDRGLRVVAEFPKPMVALMRSLPGAADVVRPYDRAFPVHYVSRAFNTGLLVAPPRLDGSQPDGGQSHSDQSHRNQPFSSQSDRSQPYIGVSRQRRIAWRTHVDAETTLRVGVVWASKAVGLELDPFAAKSIPLDALRPLTTIPDVTIYSLQTGTETTRLANMSPPLRVIDLGSRFRDFRDTAAAIANLDLVITVDTAVLHLAGAMHHPCWGLLPYRPCWRWPIAGERTPWYPSVRLFRQPSPGRWSPVVDEVRAALAALAARRREEREGSATRGLDVMSRRAPASR
jgi:tetratricopeptide (TPR) repeat protein